MKQGWEIKKLSEICISSNGLWKGKNPPFTTIAVLRSTNFTKDCKIKLDDVAYIEVEEKSFAKRRLQKNDIVVERSGGGPNQPVGRVLLFDIEDENYSFCNFTSALRVLDTTIVSPIYLHRYLTYFYLSGQTINIQSNTIGLRNLDYTKYLDISIPVPPIAEQKRIVEILDIEFEKIDALKANAERSLQQAKDLFQSALKHELQPKEGWYTAQLKDKVRVINGRAYKKEDLLGDGKYRVLRVGNFFTNESWYYSNLELDEDKYCEDGDLLYAWSASFGPKIWTGEKVIYHYHIWKMITNGNIDKRYLFYWLQSSHLTNQVMSNLHGTTMAHITKGIMETTIIGFPSFEKQLNIVSRLDKLCARCKALEENYNKTITLCDDMKQALLRQAFNGEL